MSRVIVVIDRDMYPDMDQDEEVRFLDSNGKVVGVKMDYYIALGMPAQIVITMEGVNG